MSGDRQRGRPLRILVVDDHLDTAKTLASIFQLDGHEARFFTNGPEALLAAAKWWPDVMVVDLLMPGMSGYEVGATVLRQRDQPIPLMIAHTSTAREEEIRKCHQAGFDYCLEKPVKLNKLLEFVAQRQTGRASPVTSFLPLTTIRLPGLNDNYAAGDNYRRRPTTIRFPGPCRP
jgi:CheY-like chemotaxis protein